MALLAGTVIIYHLKRTSEEIQAQELLLVQGHQVGQHVHEPGACTPNSGEGDLALYSKTELGGGAWNGQTYSRQF